ncbi:MAG TPA: amidohydrolase family protein [Acidimicrobiia bacterium]|nr:amidohydrolase family protein [Acidimicrobiia bacterium]
MTERVIDADGHVLEPMSAWDGLAESAAIHVTTDKYGLHHVFAGEQEIVTAPLGLLGTPGSDMSAFSKAKPFADAQPGGFDPVIRLGDMDTEGIDVAVLYPSVGLNFWAVKDPDAAVALARAYNDWLSSYCAADPRRLFGAAMLPVQDVDAAVAELRRARTELGFPAAFVRPNPCNGRLLADPAHEPLWEAAEELDVTIGIHEGSSNTIRTLGADRMFNPFVHHAASHAFEEMLACAQLIAFGVLERHPALRIVFLESGGGWVPYWTYRLDEQVHGFGGFCPAMKLKPSEYFARQCWISFEIDEPTLPALIPFIGEDRVVWGSDYPHHDATFPGAVDELREVIASLPPSVRAKVLGGNAAACYHLPPA